MRILNLLAILLTFTLTACSGIEIKTSEPDEFAAGHYRYYSWRSEPLPANASSNEPYYMLDPALRKQVNSALQKKGYELNAVKAQFTVDYVFAMSLRQGAEPSQASNISINPSVTPNRQIDQASVDNAIALGGLKETNNILLQINDASSRQEVWRAVMSKIVENANAIDEAKLDSLMRKAVKHAVEELPSVEGTL